MSNRIQLANQLIENNKGNQIDSTTRNAIKEVYGVDSKVLDQAETNVIIRCRYMCRVIDVLYELHYLGYKPKVDTVAEENTTVAEVVETIIENTTVAENPIEIKLESNDITSTNEVLEVDSPVVDDDDFIQINDNVKIPSMSYAQEYWGTTQTVVVVPSKHINATKKPPISTMIGVSAMSAKEGVMTIDYSGKGARIMNVRRINKLTRNLIETRDIKASTLNTHIRKLLKLKTKEFEYVTLVNPNNNKEEGYYRLDYSDGFVQLDLRLMHYMFTCYSDNMIQAYIVFLWNCRDGWSQLTREQMAQHLGLSKHSDKQAKMIMDKLVMDGLIEQKTEYQSIQVIDKVTGIPKAVAMPYYEYRVVDINEYME